MIGTKPKLAKSGKVLLLLIAAWISVLTAACAGSRQAGGGSVTAERKGGQEANTRERVRVVKASAGVTAAGKAKHWSVARVGEAEARAGDGTVTQAGAVQARVGDTAVKDGGEVPERNAAGEDLSRRDHSQESHPQELTLKVGGDPGTGFSGACSVGEEEKIVGGRIPQRYVFERGGAGLECEIRKKGGGAVEVVVAGKDVRSVQRTGTREGTIRFAFSEGGISTSRNQIVTSSDRSSSYDSR